MRVDLRRARQANYRSNKPDRPYVVKVETPRGSGIWRNVAVTWNQYCFAGEYEAARQRQYEATQAREKYSPPPREPPIDALEPQDALTPRQELFSQYYAAQPVATRAAMLAGYSERSAATLGWKLLRHPLVLDRIAQLRAQRNLHYRIEPDTLHDKLEAVFFEALESGSHAAAISALKMQAALGGLMDRRRAAPPPARGACPADAVVAAAALPPEPTLQENDEVEKGKVGG